MAETAQGRSDGGYIGIYTPKKRKKKNSSSKLFMGQKWRHNGYSTVLYPSPQKNFYTPKQISGYAPETALSYRTDRQYG